MRIAALSDFHIGATARGDVFRHEEARFLAFLDELEDAHDVIVLVGDIFQAEHGRDLRAATESRELGRACARLPALWQRLSRPPYRYLYGNHDKAARTMFGALDSLRLEENGFVVYFTHGHQFDPLLQNIYMLTRVSTWFSGRVRWARLGRAADWLEHKDIVIKHERFKGSNGPYGRGARALLREHRADVVVMGHTHMPVMLDLPEGVYANTGSCSVGNRMYVSIDTAARSVDFVRRD